jgi:Fuc2NAc and GlcNAc transferase
MIKLAIAIPVAVFVSSWWLTGRLRDYALERQVLDVPNGRSLHSVATPRGGGLAIALSALPAFVLAALVGILPWPHLWAFAGGGALVAAVGFLDDLATVSPARRLFAHFAAAAWVLWCVGGLPPVRVLDGSFDLGWVGVALALLYLVWLVNLTNFMDGIDGIAAVESITVSAAGAVLYAVAPAGEPQWAAPVILAAAALGFLMWNWPPAQIFMGDGGSGFLGLMLGALSLQAAWSAPPLLWSWIILVGVFAVDATVTLVRRVIRGDRISDAHRTHAYQHAAQYCGAHRTVTLSVAAINLFWLLPLATLVARGSLDGLIGVLIAYTPLAAVAMWLGAGVPRRFPDQVFVTNV